MSTLAKPNLSVQVSGIKMKNPVTVASGTFGLQSDNYFDLSVLGAVVPKGITLNPKEGNKPPRTIETPSGMLNAIGLQNPGIDHFIKEVLPRYEKFDIPIIINISAESAEEYALLAEKLTATGKITGIEINVSCPNLKRGGFQFGSDPKETEKVVKAVRKATDLTIITKLTPNVTDIMEIAKAAEGAGSDAISLINTLLGTSIDVKTRKFHLANVTGGLSGPAVKPVAVRMVWQCFNAVKIPIIGMGGISNANDALEFILAGATAVAVGTYNFVNPRSPFEIIEGIKNYLIENNIADINDLRGAVETV
ncbi:MAG: Dihydroorotate dehydrogenase [candidate division CPR2 bacterium GW2011_GWC1_41_48]|uniref:Dihydroorotate dehydrogenase n=1 Tax=candidate division CPR2 bacterium GW2011_GWC1_41_48 TaxID=1618344 RepID=A0A0G0W900_UNCC2|nr:MAG: Dihydroorotate dehydrogenase [candidate division CPR2 bacterium GW2011_GWC2_39_35]KKR28982.1 MAG: Dihydroorotate dehydrogenase [candidate division CPR2 bacterium GW2011_GWD2_39_7]KKR29258.1 MAG: Dihydroorotate dehydrogenase [candidate division CPR2 bacterium GW2011_GWD1_39_7]KKS09479.1 MAG: Dihydroorotate dehydrogenase [candidate division CPR2 bacterium GW2011_GWC1_41_48]OGB62187.1 MAG: dihydroorotate dehydrogenase B catalytic subunit [candidate division CPR2 bacterium GWD1_39_7]OGB703